MLFARKQPRPDISTGSVYCRRRPGNLVELVRVKSVWSDDMGITHVEFDFGIERQTGEIDEFGRNGRSAAPDKRTLSLDSFFETYGEGLLKACS